MMTVRKAISMLIDVSAMFALLAIAGSGLAGFGVTDGVARSILSVVLAAVLLNKTFQPTK